MYKQILTWYIGLNIVLVNHAVVSCSSKVAPSTTNRPSFPISIENERLSLLVTKPNPVVFWQIEGDRSLNHPSSSSQQEELSHSPVNGHNEGLVLKVLPTQDTGISNRHAGPSSDDDETSDSHQHQSNNKNNKPMGLVLFSNKSIHCNDRTTAGYYIRKSPIRNSNLWIIFLEGGWYCFDERSCQNRWLRLRHLMSSHSWNHYKNVGGILSSDPSENPYWWNANHVFVPYCSSDTWSGTAGTSGNSFSFMGALIIDEVIKSLIKDKGITTDSTVILAGSSAGGTGVLINLDRVENLLSEEFGSSEIELPRVRGIADSGWFIDKLPSFLDKLDCQDVILCPPEISLKKGMALWNARLPENCQNSYPNEPWSCFFGYRLYPTLKSSLFVFNWMFDQAQMLVNNVPTPAVKKEEWDYVYKLGDELKKTLINVTNVFIPACVAHTVLTHRDWKRIEVNSVYLPRALKCWESGGIIEESNFLPSKSSQKYWEEYEEEPNNLSKGNRKLFQSGNRIASSATAGILKPPSGFPQVVSSNDSSRRSRRRHNRHRQHTNNTNSKRERRKSRKKLEKEKSLEEKSNSNRRRNIQIKHKVPQMRQRQNERTNGRSYNKERRNNLPSSNPNNNKLGLDRSVSISDNQVRNRNQKKKRKWFSVCDAAESGIEKCNWPQCNKSCPKLINPVTGEEVDFKDLLKSFGLDMGLMAKALGIDLATLHSMDHQVLLQMLTQNP